MIFDEHWKSDWNPKEVPDQPRCVVVGSSSPFHVEFGGDQQHMLLGSGKRKEVVKLRWGQQGGNRVRGAVCTLAACRCIVSFPNLIMLFKYIL